MVPLESKFKSDFLSELSDKFPGCMIIRPDANIKQGLPDTLILFNDKWVALEFKRNASAPKRPNQQYYIDKFGEMSYAAFVYPENKEEVLDALHETFYPRR